MVEQAVYPSLSGRSVFVTGGATGIGAAMVEAFSAQGAHVGFIDLDRSSGDALVVATEEKYGHRPWFRCVDVADVPALQGAIEDAGDTLGPLCVLVNNVANDTRHAPADVTPAFWRECLAVNLDAAFFAAQAVHRMMRKAGGGSIINLSSINALLGPANMPGYVTAKAGLIGMTRALANDFGPDNIRVNAILPGWVVTPRQLDTWLTPQAEAEWMQQVALKSRLLPGDVAALALFLAADQSRMITGQKFTVDGGRT